MSYAILMGEHALVCAWVAAQIDGMPDLGGGVGFGALSGDTLIGGIVFTEHRHPDIRVSAAGIGPWLTRRLLRVGFAYAFQDLRCRRISAFVRADNLASRRLVGRLGFTLEGTHPDSFDDGGTLISYGLCARHCRWLKG